MGEFRTLIDLTGKRLGSFFVLKRVKDKKRGESCWLCKCDCGRDVVVRGSRLRNNQGHCKGCQPHNVNIKHGLHRHPSYTTWAMMKQRCENPNATGYHNYGAIGVRVCERWHDFKMFVEDVGSPPTKKHTLDRFPNKNGDYEPGNWRWATDTQQQRNTRTNRILKFNGSEKSVSEWSEITGIKHSTIHQRLKRGWSVEMALTEKLKLQ